MDAHNDSGHDACTALLNPAQFGHAPNKPATVHSISAKAEATLIARAALAGVVVVRIEADDGRPQWIASRWALTRSFDNLDQLGAWLDRVTGTPA